MNRILRILVIVIMLFIGIGVSASAEQINNYDVQIIINPTATLDVIEKIEYDFGTLDRHGIFRNIPYVITNKDGKKFQLKYTNFNVINQQRQPVKFTTSKSNGEYVLKIGDPDKTVTSVYTYIIQYSVQGGIQYFSDHDEIFFNTVGSNWPVPILSSSTVVRLNGADIKDPFMETKCFTGVYGSTESDCSTTIVNNTIISSTQAELNANNGYSIVVSLKKNIVAYDPPSEYIEYGKNLFIAYALINVVGSFLFFLLWFFNGRDPRLNRSIVREYDPPTDGNKNPYSPLEVGVLTDEYLNPRDLSAEIIQLAINKLILIKENKEKKVFGLIETNEILFLKGEKFDDSTTVSKLNEYQKIIYNAIATKLRYVEELSTDELKSDFMEIKDEVEDKIYQNLYQKGLFEQNPNLIRNKYFISTTCLTFILPLIGITGLLFAKNMPRKTLQGAWAKYKADGLYKFITSQDRQFKFQEEQYYMFEKLLPYAIAMGVAKVWAKKFEHLTNQPEWFVSNDPNFNNLALTNTLENNLQKIESMYTPTPTSSGSGFNSGFSSGGGFSGGGFSGGGGGGRSW